MARRLTTERFIAEATQKHGGRYSYAQTVVLSRATKVLIHCNECGLDFSQAPGNHLKGAGCPGCWSNRRKALSPTRWTLESFIERSKAVHGPKYDYEQVDFRTADTKVLIRCLDCGHTFSQTPKAHVRGSGCPPCGFQRSAQLKTGDVWSFISRSQAVHGKDRYDYTAVVYRGSETPVAIGCRVCGFQFEQAPAAHLRGRGCPPCSVVRSSEARRTPLEDWVLAATEKHGVAFDYSKVVYVSGRDPVVLICNACQHDFLRSPSNHIRYGAGCPKCDRHQVSRAETEWLDSLGVPERQVRIKIPGWRRAAVDGFDPKTNTVYSFLGSFWHADPSYMDPDEMHPVQKRTNREVYTRTMKRINDMVLAGYRVVYIWELAWRRGEPPTVIDPSVPARH